MCILVYLRPAKHNPFSICGTIVYVAGGFNMWSADPWSLRRGVRGSANKPRILKNDLLQKT